ncbi:MAG: hypothetical protein ACMUHB_02985 [Thermoplasmatota archaeon]
MVDEKNEEFPGIELKVKKSPISGSGIARVHLSIIELPEFSEGKVVSVETDKVKRVLRLVADKMMDKGRISLRLRDMEKLGVREGDRVTLMPVKSVGKRIGERFSFLNR